MQKLKKTLKMAKYLHFTQLLLYTISFVYFWAPTDRRVMRLNYYQHQ